MFEGGGVGHATGEGADDDGDAQAVHQAYLLGGNGGHLVDEVDFVIGDEFADDFFLESLVEEVADYAKGLDVDFVGELGADFPEEAVDFGFGGEVDAVLVVWEGGEDFGAGAGVDDEVDVDAALAEVFEEEPGEAGLAAEFERGVLGDEADFHLCRGG